MARKRLRPRRRPAPFAVATLIAYLPDFLRLLYRLVRDPRVSRLDKALVGTAIAYVLTPADLIPDIFSFIGWVDDLYLVALLIDRLLVRAGAHVLLEHWQGSRGGLSLLLGALDQLATLLPLPVRQLLGARVPRAKRSS